MRTDRLLRGAAVTTLVFASVVTATVLTAPAADALAPVNPVRVDLNGHPANSGFLVFVEHNVALNADQSEGTIAVGGNLSFNSTYNVAAHTPKDTTFTAPGDSGPTYLYVGGGMAWTGSQILRVLSSGFTKIADSTTYTALNTDQNGASVTYRIVQKGAGFDSFPRIEGTTNAQNPASIATPVPASLIDVAGAFTRYRQVTTELAGCPTNTVLTDPNGGTSPIPQPYTAGARGRLTLTPGVTNFLQMSTQDLANLSEITFTNQPSASTPLVVNVTGAAFNGTIPNLAGIGPAQAPYILWNFPQASSVVVSGGASIEGTIYAPNAAVNWRPTQNVEGNLIAASFTHGPTSLLGNSVRALHDFPFATTVSCPNATPTGTLTLVKHVVNTGGGTGTPADWTLSAHGPQTVTGPGNSAAVTNVTVHTGDYLLSESGGLPNYTPGAWTCSGGALVDQTVAVTAGAQVSCQITNTFQPPPPPKGTLTLVKHVVNTGGGTAVPGDWTLTADGPQLVTGAGNSADVTNVSVDPGDYDLSESGGPIDYTAGPWSCSGGALTDNTVTVAADADVTCAITNSYDPPPAPTGTITLVKNVVNTGGGIAAPSDWTLTAANPPTVVTGPGNSANVTGQVVPTGNYVLSESDGPDDYVASAWTCSGGGLDGSTVTVAADAHVTCTITNTYDPPPAPTGTITLVKHVDNTGGGIARPAQWKLTADGPLLVTGRANSANVTHVVVPTGDYALSESDGPPRYTASGWSCTGGAVVDNTVTVAANAEVSCEITNTFQPLPAVTGTLTLVKHVENAGGGLATPDQWTLTATGRRQTVTGPGNSPQVSGVVVSIGQYQLTESGGTPDYTAGSWSCTGATLSGSTVTVAANDDVTCEITNSYHPAPSPPAGSLTLVKHVDGGPGTPEQWTLTGSGPQTTVTGPGNSEQVTGIVVPVGGYALSESGGPPHYVAGTWTCAGAALDGTTVAVTENSLVTCEITNTFGPPAPTSPQTVAPVSTIPPAGSTAPALANTGVGSGAQLALGMALILTGALALAVPRRRRHRTH